MITLQVVDDYFIEVAEQPNWNPVPTDNFIFHFKWTIMRGNTA